MNALSNGVRLKFVAGLLVMGWLAVAIPLQAEADVVIDDFLFAEFLDVDSLPSPNMGSSGPTMAAGILGSRTLTATNEGTDGSNSELSVGGGEAILSTSVRTDLSMQTLSYIFDPQNIMPGDKLVVTISAFDSGLAGTTPTLTVTADSGMGAIMESFDMIDVALGELTFDFGDLMSVDISDLTSLELKFNNLQQGDDLVLNEGIIIREGRNGGNIIPEPSSFGMMAMALLGGLGLSTRMRRRRSKR
ncbi:MAG: hypothetical protein GTO26_02295 [Planctomycetales bacterium]|nr:hypothetical protein [Planctomycetales bacterium]